MIGGILSVLFCIGIYIAVNHNANLWNRGIVPRTHVYSDESLFDIYLSLAIIILRSDRKKTKEKRIHLQKYLIEKFPDSKSEFKNYFRNSASSTPLQLKSVANWLNRYISDRQKSQILYFLVEIAYFDGVFNIKEKKNITALARYLKVADKEFQSIIATHEEIKRKRIEKEYAEREKERQKRERSKPKPTIYRREKMALILQVPADADFRTIKKAYRNLVKIHHPDLFQNESKEMITLARERFIEIQEAYEFFEEIERRR